jgi:uncharacterized protein (TIGR02996 family)
VTAEEAAALKPGDVVECRRDGGWARVRVEEGWGPAYPEYRGAVCVRRVGRTARGDRYPRAWVNPALLSRARDLDPAPANVFADWLDDHGEHSAARLLRAAFPLGAPAEEVTA